MIVVRVFPWLRQAPRRLLIGGMGSVVLTLLLLALFFSRENQNSDVLLDEEITDSGMYFAKQENSNEKGERTFLCYKKNYKTFFLL